MSNMKISLIFVALAFFCSQCEAIELKYTKLKFSYINGHDYCCEVENQELITSSYDREITSIKLPWGASIKDDDVTCFDSNDKVVKFFPRGLTKYFKGISTVDIKSAQLEEVTKEDLKEFGGILKSLILTKNRIKKIEVDLFIYNPNLEEIGLDHNKIKQIKDGTFDGLKELKVVYLHDNPCTLEHPTRHDLDDTILNCKDEDCSRLTCVAEAIRQQVSDQYFS